MTTYRDPYDNPLHYRETGGCLQAISTVLAFIVLAFIAIWLSACAPTKSVTQTDYSDSIRTEYRHDTVVITIRDTVYLEQKHQSEKTDDTGIEFVAQGGTYNTRTGEATGVKTIRNTKKEKEQQQTILQQATQIEAMRARNDSLQRLVKSYVIMQDNEQNTTEIKPKTSGWHTFLVWWFGITAALLLCYGAYKGLRLYRKFTIGV